MDGREVKGEGKKQREGKRGRGWEGRVACEMIIRRWSKLNVAADNDK